MTHEISLLELTYAGRMTRKTVAVQHQITHSDVCMRVFYTGLFHAYAVFHYGDFLLYGLDVHSVP